MSATLSRPDVNPDSRAERLLLGVRFGKSTRSGHARSLSIKSVVKPQGGRNRTRHPGTNPQTREVTTTSVCPHSVRQSDMAAFEQHFYDRESVPRQHHLATFHCRSRALEPAYYLSISLPLLLQRGAVSIENALTNGITMEEESRLIPNYCHGLGVPILERLAPGLSENLEYVKPSEAIRLGFAEEPQCALSLKTSPGKLHTRENPAP